MTSLGAAICPKNLGNKARRPPPFAWAIGARAEYLLSDVLWEHQGIQNEFLFFTFTLK